MNRVEQALEQYKNGNRDRAVKLCRQALNDRAERTEALLALGQFCEAEGRADEASNYFQQARGNAPHTPGNAPHTPAQDFNRRLSLALAHVRAKQFAEALELAEPLFADFPENPHVLAVYGNALVGVKRPEDAVPCFELVVRRQSTSHEAWNNLAIAYLAWEKAEAAEQGFRMALRLKPDYGSAHFNLGNALHKQHRWVEAIECYSTALEYEPDQALIWASMGASLRNYGDSDSALTALTTALKLDPELSIAHMNMAICLLQRGEFVEGWAHYESRQNSGSFIPAGCPVWDGSETTGTVRIQCEQGLGDTLQFARYLREVKKRAGKVVLAAHDALVPWLTGHLEGVDEVVSFHAPGDPAMPCVRAMSLPHVLGLPTDFMPEAVPYLRASAEMTEKWKSVLDERSNGGLRIGLVWQGNPAYELDRFRSPGLKPFWPLLSEGKHTYVSLQQKHGLPDLMALPGNCQLARFGDQIDREGAFVDTSGIIENLDLVICSDTATAHLAAALGKETWVVLATNADWRWGRSGEECAWYPNMRLFRQETDGDWDGVVQRVQAALEERWISREQKEQP